MSNLQSIIRNEQVRESSHGVHFNIAQSQGDSVDIVDEADQLWILYKQNPTDQLRNRLVERYMPIVRNRAERIWARLPDGIELDDLISAGNFGLMDAISVFDPARGIRFEAFCLPRIQGSIVDELRKMDWVPRIVRSKATKLNDAYKNLQIEHGRKPTDQEVAEYLNISVEELQQLYAETHNVNISSLDKSWGDNDGSKEIREIDVVPDKRSEDPTERLAKIDVIRNFTKGLTKTERMIIILYYYEEFTMREIGASLELSESRVSQMHSAIVDRIKKMYKSQM
ncbi:MAG: FliA/WhiG family RNA polymerase sigma factor [Planctomycetaceae bacterium]|jgi:RNA polymerase sigma factor for flagellar operon FliA|nr:FliA/WhiG family RNA polymerase sigma factor [Planctomycetaceae bacterium]